jgi:hypothetical protein
MVRRLVIVLGAVSAGAVAAPALGFSPIEIGRSFLRLWQPPVGVTSWDVLGKATVSVEKVDGMDHPILNIPPAVAALTGTLTKLTGFMFPIDAQIDTDHFLLVELPIDCPFCFANWSQPTRMAEVWMQKPMRYVVRQVTLQGRLEVMDDDPSGIVYRLIEAQPAS